MSALRCSCTLRPNINREEQKALKEMDKHMELVMPHQAAHHYAGSSSPLRDSPDTCEEATSPECSPTH